ncbi:MAG: hypothetical protein AAF387_18815 [Pseudomonadota bacterium]
MLGLDEALVNAVLEDWRTAPVSDRQRAILGYLEKLTLTPTELTEEDIAPLREAGLSDRAVEEAAFVAFNFSVMDRLADAFDFYIPTDTEQQATGSFLYKRGYALCKLIR